MKNEKSWQRIQIIIQNSLLAKIKSAAIKDNRSMSGWIKLAAIEKLSKQNIKD